MRRTTSFMVSRLHISRSSARRRQNGITLVEWMVSISIGLVLLSGLMILFSHQSNAQNELQKSSRQIENGRYAMQLLREDIQLAGYYGEYSRVSELTVPATLPNPCATTVADLSAAMPFPIQGYDAPGAGLPADLASCPLLAANHLDGTDILVVRYADIEPLTGGLDAGRVYLQTGLTASRLLLNHVLGVASGAAIDTAVFNLKKKDDTTAPVRKYNVHIYFVSPCSVPANGSTCSNGNTDDGGVSIPTLKRIELSVSGGVPKFSTVSLVEGIENMQIDYGFDAATGDGSPDSYATDAATVAQWADVMALRVHLLARNSERSGGHQDSKTYNLGLSGTTAATGDAFKRHVFSQLIRVINPSARRDQ